MKLFHIIVDEIDIEHVKSFMKTIIISSLHCENLSGECKLMGGSHLHILGVPKFSQRQLRDISLQTLSDVGITGGNKLKINFLTNKWIHIQTETHYNNVIKYLLQYKVLVNNIDKYSGIDFGLRKAKDFDEFFKINKEQTMDALEYAEWRKNFPDSKVWKHKLLSSGAPKYMFGKYAAMEKQAVTYEQNRPITEAEEQLVRNTCKFIANAANWIKTECDKHPIGHIIIIFGPPASYKSTIARVLGHLYGGATTWPGSQFIKENDTLKWDSHVRSNNRCLIIEEMKWQDKAKKIQIGDTLRKLKELFSGTNLNVRVAKTSDTPDMPLKLDCVFITSNNYVGENKRTIQSYLDNDPSLARRITVCDITDFNAKGTLQECKYADACEALGSSNVADLVIAKLIKKVTSQEPKTLPDQLAASNIEEEPSSPESSINTDDVDLTEEFNETDNFKLELHAAEQREELQHKNDQIKRWWW